MFPQFFRSMLVVAVLTLSLPLVGFAAQQTTAAIPNELLVFDINRPITTADRGFPRNDPPRPEANGDWTNPINFAEGTLYMRVAVRSQPKAQAMRLQFCIWQDNFKLESCAPLADVSGTPGTVVTWSRAIPEPQDPSTIQPPGHPWPHNAACGSLPGYRAHPTHRRCRPAQSERRFL